jgi:hypothetical protein
VITTYPENSPTPGVGDLDSTAVTLKISSEGRPNENATLHVYPVGSSWRYSLDQRTYDAESKVQCP